MKITLKTDKDKLMKVFQIAGELDVHHVKNLKAEVMESLEGEGWVYQLDMDEVSYLDSSGLGMLVYLKKEIVKHEGTLKIVVFGGANVTYLNSVIAQADEKYPIPDYAPDDQDDLVFGANIGAGLELRMGTKWDMNVSGKYILSKFSQFIISIEGVYYFKSRRRAYRR